MDEDIKYALEQEKRELESKFKRLSWLAKKLGITDKDKLKEITEFVDLFRECNSKGWISLK